MLPTDTGPGGLIRRAGAIRVGITDSQLHRRTARDELTRIHRGSYLGSDQFRVLDPLGQHLVRVAATLTAQQNPTIVSHQSAAAIHGLPLWNVDLGRVHLIQERQGVAVRTAHLHKHAAKADSVSTAVVGGVVVTSVARTVFDLACSLDFESAVVLADAALNRGLTTSADLDTEAVAGRGRHGRAQAASVIAFADGRSESPGESRSRVGMCRAGIVMPDLQYQVRGPDGVRAGRADFAWAAVRLLGEFDGMAKYGRLLRPGQRPEDAFVAERRREDRLRELGFEIIRWIWSDLARPDLLYARIRAAVERAGRRVL